VKITKAGRDNEKSLRYEFFAFDTHREVV